MELNRLIARLASVPAYFGLRLGSGVLLLKLSASLLSVAEFTTFVQLVFLASVLNLIAVGGTQNGLIRQAAAAADSGSLVRTHTAALMIWAAELPIVFAAIALASRGVSDILVGTSIHWPAVIAITALALSAGPGQIWCSMLSGRKRVPSALGAQAAGLITGTAAACFFIVQGNPVGAAIGFASGSLVMMSAAFLLSRGVRTRLASPGAAAPCVKPLIRYSAAFAATSGYTAIVLFGLRSLYRDSFGSEALGYWMAANRVSDMSTQLLGLFMIQFVVAHLATLHDPQDRRRFLLACWTAGTAIMAAALVVFSLAPSLLVRLFLSEAFVPAIPIIRTYMVGDVLRVSASLAMFAAFAAGRPGRYAAIEMATLTILGALATALILAGEPRAPQFAYVGAYGITALVVAAVFLARGGARISVRPLVEWWQRRGERRTLRRGSAGQPPALPIGPGGPSPAVPPAA